MVRLLHEGFELRIVRSMFDQSPLYAELLAPDTACIVETVPLWRLKKLVDTGQVRPDTGSLATATHIVLERTP
ncbi:hypothetical protein DFLDMN_001893 [Cupriavidus sp. H19C3]